MRRTYRWLIDLKEAVTLYFVRTIDQVSVYSSNDYEEVIVFARDTFPQEHEGDPEILTVRNGVVVGQTFLRHITGEQALFIGN